MNAMQKNIAEAESALTCKPLRATSAERFLILNEIKSKYKELPQPLRFANTLSELLARVSTPVYPYDLIAGRCVDRELTDAEETEFQAFVKHPDHPKKMTFLSSGHCTYSWKMLANEGLTGLKEKLQKKLENTADESQRIFLTAIIQIYDAIADYLLRYAETAAAQGLHELAENLRIAATKRPTGFASALQLLWIVAMIDCAYITENPTLTVGRLDQILYPFYQRDIESGALTEERARAYITDYYCKHNLIMGRGEHQLGDATNSTTFSRICNFDAPQYLMLAGTDAREQPAVNKLTYLFAECIQPSFKNPVIVVRYFKDMDTLYPALWDTLMQKALQSASLMFYNDDNMLKTYERIGLPPEDRVGYTHFGCNWASPGEDSAWMQLGPNASKFKVAAGESDKITPTCIMRVNAEHGWAEDLMIVIRELVKRPADTLTIEDLYQTFFARMGAFIDQKLAYLSQEMDGRQQYPSALLTFGDCFLKGSLESAQCFAASAKYHFQMQSFYAFGTVVDCFTVIDQLVFREKKLTLAQLLDAAERDFEGCEEILALCQGVEKYGSDSPLSNLHTKRISTTACDLVIEKNRPYFEEKRLFMTPCMQSDTWHLKLGLDFGATPDGRRAHTTFSQNSRPSNGACINGLTGMFNAMLQLPSDGILSGALNLDVDPKQFAGEEGRALFGALLGTYFNLGGLHAQVSAVGVDQLIDAKIHPDAHRDLRVRVTGYSGIFVDMCENLQDDIIERLK